MASPSISVSDELLAEFDQTISYRKGVGELPQDTDRSDVIRELIQDYVDEHPRQVGNANLAETAAK